MLSCADTAPSEGTGSTTEALSSRRDTPGRAPRLEDRMNPNAPSFSFNPGAGAHDVPRGSGLSHAASWHKKRAAAQAILFSLHAAQAIAVVLLQAAASSKSGVPCVHAS